MEDTLLYPRELIAERVVFTPADHAQIALGLVLPPTVLVQADEVIR